MNCPRCGEALTEHTCVTADLEPQPGDLSVCSECFAPLKFTETLGLEILPLMEALSLSREDLKSLALAIRLARKVKETRGCHNN